MSTSYLLPLTSSAALDLNLSGGKGANLARLTQAGLPVPDGVVLSTAAYREFVRANHLEVVLAPACQANPNAPLADLEALSVTIRQAFHAAPIPTEIAAAIQEWYRQAGQPLLAVRSSATTEDLPGLSFAGQQDTFLNVQGDDALLQAVVRCWSSLWTARAIGYRLYHRVPQHDLALAVILQVMVPSQVAGVMFTANPLTGKRNEVVINAAFGLGEALVSGRVEPDEYVVDAHAQRILTKSLGRKVPFAAEGKLTPPEATPPVQALSDEAILTLAQLGQRIEALYHFPQDIEWAWVDGLFYILQSRPITALYPLPDGLPEQPLHVLFSMGAVQGMLDPITPLGREIILHLFVAGGRLLGYHLTPTTQRAVWVAGERLWVNLTPLLHTRVGRRFVPLMLGLVEPSTQQAVQDLLDDPQIGWDAPVRLSTRLRLLRFGLPLLGNVLLNLLTPDQRREALIARFEDFLNALEADLRRLPPDPRAKLEALSDAIPRLFRALPGKVRLLIAIVATGIGSLNLLRLLAGQIPAGTQGRSRQEWDTLVLELTRSLPYNPTTAMDLALWAMAQGLRQHPLAREELTTLAPAALAAAYRAGHLAAETQQQVSQFLARYGRRGLAEFDLGRPRWNEDPTSVFAILQTYLNWNEQQPTPDQVAAQGEARAHHALTLLEAGIRHTPLGWLKVHLVRFLGRRVRALLGLREYPKFFLVRVMGAIREVLLAAGRELCAQGVLSQPDDLVFLTLDELHAFARDPGSAVWHERIAQRRQVYEREMRRRQVPRLLLSDGRAFYAGISVKEESETTLWGSPVSPGIAEGRVRIVFDPRQAELQPGEILVCPGTDPSWTPLFLSAAGLIMEVGGMMTHGAVVAREYGLPAVVGVDRATQRLHNGQRIRLDGATGRIDLLPDEAPTQPPSSAVA
ncbi:PEP/pyruvate-binding domain-containing protein [Thermanaerothrix sp. 4228-RoL]|uniref:PEP/pyruvate-binding domain-containing protein n=1 Tax=Thermanaerothrix solaris TaxID=3058434 RepID=A0ABU3NMP2_9CHLR|nr:PEP/pyruvate-binding domain-containing protein [Thermanaerothrix sp. 4228-RoL]MDT8898104.1 PEP/pyruvate-binding domain-containing protein [Thermanaerothrix sp. 4228-RoL]